MKFTGNIAGDVHTPALVYCKLARWLSCLYQYLNNVLVFPGEVACKLLSSAGGQCYQPSGFSSEPPNNLPLPRPSNKGVLHSSKSSHSVKPNSPHPFSVESMSTGSPQVRKGRRVKVDGRDLGVQIGRVVVQLAPLVVGWEGRLVVGVS